MKRKVSGIEKTSAIAIVVIVIVAAIAVTYYATSVAPPGATTVTSILPGTTITKTFITTPTSPVKKETVVVWTFPLGAEEEHKKHLQEMEEAFEAKNPDIDMEIETYPWDGRDARMITAAAGGEAPDICYLNTRHIAKLSFLGGLQPVEDLLPEAYLDDAYPSDIEAATAGGHIWAGVCLKAVAPYVWWYNPDIFEEVGITPPTGPEDAWSWSQFIEAGKKLREKGYYIAHPSKPSVVCITRPIIQQTGVDICQQGPPFVTEVMFNNPNGVRAFKFWQDLFYTYDLMHPSMLGAIPEWQPERELFAKKEVAIMLDTTGLPVYLSTIETDVEAEVLGYLWDDEAGKEYMTGDVVPGYFGVFKQAYDRHPEITKRAYQWIMSEEAIELWAKWGGFASPYQKHEGWLKGTELYDTIRGDDMAKWLPYGDLEWGNHPAANDMYNILQANMDAVANGIMTPEEAVLDAAEKCVEAMIRSLAL